MVDNNTSKIQAIEIRTFGSGKQFVFTICNPPDDTVVNDSVHLQIQSQDNASSRDIIDDSDPISDAHTGMTQNFQDLREKEQLHTTPRTILFIPDIVKC